MENVEHKYRVDNYILITNVLKFLLSLVSSTDKFPSTLFFATKTERSCEKKRRGKFISRGDQREEKLLNISNEYIIVCSIFVLDIFYGNMTARLFQSDVMTSLKIMVINITNAAFDLSSKR